MEFIGGIGRQIKYGIKKDEVDSKLDFRKSSKEWKKIRSFAKFEKEKTLIRLEYD